jgi:epoxyqueuosine reductase
MKQAIIEKARSLGFGRVTIADIQRIEGWREAAKKMGVDIDDMDISDDPLSLMPEARAVIMLAMPYAPYENAPGEAAPDAYYVTANRAYARASELADWIKEQGYQATARCPLPIKPLAERSGMGQYARSGLIAVEGFGTQTAIQAILTDAPLAADREPAPRLCVDCGACVRACPVDALPSYGRVDARKCLRDKYSCLPVEEEYRHLITELLGCDKCRRCCPINAGVNAVQAPDELRRSAALKNLLQGELGTLTDWIGSNYARPARLSAIAALIAANLNRGDLLPDIERLLASEHEEVREHASWAVKKLSKK